MRYVHISDILAFKSCRRAWDFSSPFRRNLEPVRPYRPFVMGRVIHRAMELFYRDGRPLDDTVVEEYTKQFAALEESGIIEGVADDTDLVVDEFELVRSMMETYGRWRKQPGTYNDSNWEFDPKWFEAYYETPLKNPQGKRSNKIGIALKVDVVARFKPTGRLWLWEFKTARSIQERMSSLPFDEQASAYLSVMSDLLGEPVEGIMYTILRKKAPEVPKVLQSGTLSLAKSIDSDADTFLRAAIEHHGCSKQAAYQQYRVVIDHLISQPNKFVHRGPLTRSPEELENARTHLWTVAREALQPDVPVYPHGGNHCAYCRFRRPCELMNRSSHEELQVLLEDEYKVRSSYYGDES